LSKIEGYVGFYSLEREMREVEEGLFGIIKPIYHLKDNAKYGHNIQIQSCITTTCNKTPTLLTSFLKLFANKLTLQTIRKKLLLNLPPYKLYFRINITSIKVREWR